MQNLVSTT